MCEHQAATAKSLQSCPTLCDPIDGSPPGSPVPGILQARTLEWPGKNTGVGCHFLLQCVKVKSESEVAQSCPTLCDPMDCSLPGSSVHGVLQARILEWVAIWWYNRQKSPLNYVQDRIGRDDVEIVNSDIFQNFTAVGLENGM